MSFAKYKDTIELKDTVILFFGYDSMSQITVEKDKVYQTRYGALKHNDLVGKRFGCKVHCTKGWVYVLYPTPELWTVTLPHRTQILYSTDVSMVIFQLDLKPGSIVIESGTGSGSLSHALIRTIAPNGHLYTFDFHEQRVAKAKDEFKSHRIGDLVTCTHRDVLKNGFGVENVADAVFLDLPAPWEAVPHLKTSLKQSGGRICSFSPCIEQVQRTCKKLEEFGFCEIQTLECLSRPFDVKTVDMPVADLGEDLMNDSKESGKCFDSVQLTELQVPQIGVPKANKHDSKDMLKQRNDDKDIEMEDCEHPQKVMIKDNGENRETSVSDAMKTSSENIKVISKNKRRNLNKNQSKNSYSEVSVKCNLAPLTMPGHTGYLTFASIYCC